RWPSDIIHALCKSPSCTPALPAAMFSPTKSYGPSRFPMSLWLKPEPAMCALHTDAYAPSAGSHCNGGKPRPARSWLRRWTKSAAMRSVSDAPVGTHEGADDDGENAYVWALANAIQ